ncbi:MAG: hypothetical protein AABY22_34100 [Nanoarchaeota archaeon]
MTEKKDYIDIDLNLKNVDFDRKFSTFLKEKRQEHQESKQPFCTACAYNQFKDLKEVTIKNLSRRTKEIIGNESELNIKVDIAKYEDPSYFKLKGERKIMEKRIMHGTPTFVPIWFLDYVCKEFGHGYSIQMEQEEYDQWKKSPKSKK